MGRKQADYLSNLLGDEPDAASPAPASTVSEPVKAGATLLARDTALARVATGEVKQITQLLLDPARVRIWRGNPRRQDALTETSCRDLIDAILAEGGQKVPAIVRRVSDNPNYEYEVIAGTRRHWTVSWLRVNNYPDMMFLAQVHNLDDEAAFRISDIENRARKDVSDLERAQTYMTALLTHYNGKQARMAERLRVSPGWLSKMLTVATLPDWAIAAFSSVADIQLKAGYPLAQKIQALSNPDHLAGLAKLQAEAKLLAAEQRKAVAQGQAGIPALDVIKRLMSADLEASENEPLVNFSMPSGRVALSVLSANRNGVSIRLHAGSGASETDLAKMFKAALEALNKQGRGLTV